MRVDDDYVWGGGSGFKYVDLGFNVHGLYRARKGYGAMAIVTDFLFFCKLAKARGAIPPDWEWKKFMGQAAELLVLVFEKSDAKEKYGGENVFSPMVGGRPSLRYTANKIYGIGACHGESWDDNKGVIERVLEEIDPIFNNTPTIDNFCKETRKAVVSAFQHVGGIKSWKKLARKVDKEYKKLINQ